MKSLTNSSISRKFLTPTVLLTILLLGGLGVVMAWSSNASIRAMMQSKGNTVADFMSKLSVNAFANFDFLSLENITNQISKDPEVAFAVFYDSAHKPLTKDSARKDVSSLLVINRTITDEGGSVLGYLEIGYDKKVLSSNLNKNVVIISVGIVIAILFFAVGISVLSNRIIIKPVMRIKEAAQNMASGDLTGEIEIKGRDEIAVLGNAISTMADNLKEMLGKIRNVTNSLSKVTANIVSSSRDVSSVAGVQKTAIEMTADTIGEMDASISKVAASAESLSKSAVDTSSAIMQMKQAIERVAESSNAFESSTNETTSSIEEMIANIRQITQSLESLSSSSDGIATSITELNTAVKEIDHHAAESVTLSERVVSEASEKGVMAANAAMEGMRNIRKSVGLLSDVINSLGKRSEDIGKILTVIEEVTDQTTLLSLNAAILAAQAGEHGKAFSVVADEIKSLAERTALSTKEISGIITSVQEDTKSSVRMVADGIQAVEQGLKLVGEVNEALKGITQSSKVSTEMSKAIQRATSEESQAVRQITVAIKEMTEEVDKISNALQEQNNGSQFIIQQTEKMKEISYYVNNATGEQRDGSRQIVIAVEDVAHGAEDIAKATSLQKQQSSQMVQSMDKIQHSTGNLMQSSNEMNITIEALKENAENLLNELQKFKV